MGDRLKPAVRAGGGVIVTNNGGSSRYLVAHRPRYDDWTLPKGKLDVGETVAEAALREVEEETGLVCRALGVVGSIGYPTVGGTRKAVRFWIMEPVGGGFIPNAEVDEIAWLSAKKARERLTWDREIRVLDRAREQLEHPTVGKVFLLRHANAGRRNRRDPEDHLRPVDKRGVRQALRTAERLSSQPISRLLTSPLLRCVQTMEPLGRFLALPLEQDARLTETATVDDVAEIVNEAAGTTTVLCSHGDVISAVVEHLAGRGVELEGPKAWRKGSAWMLGTVRGSVRSARYLGSA